MNLIHTLQTADHAPLSHAGRYLYEYHGQLEAFLRRKYGTRYEDLLARPDLVGQRAVQWYSALSPPLERLGELQDAQALAVKRQYWEVRADIDRDIAELEQSRDKDRREWGALMRAVFDDANNIILTNGSQWCLLWGWAFRNDRENYLPPEFMLRPPRSTAGASEAAQPQAIAAATTSGAVPVAPEEGHDPNAPGQEPGQEGKTHAGVVSVDDDLEEHAPSHEPSTSSFGAFMGRAWRWMLLVLVLLYLACMLKCCVRRSADAHCTRMDRLRERVEAIDQRVQENCDTLRP